MEVSESDCVFLHTNVCMYVCMDGCMYVWMDGWMDGYSLWIHSPSGGLIQALPPPTGEGTMLLKRMCLTSPGHNAKPGPTGCKQPGMYRPSLLNQPAGLGKTGHRKPPPSPKESSLQEETPKHVAFSYAKVHKQVNR